MSTNAEAQEEETEVLISIYGSDPNFKQIGSGNFQYRVGEVGQSKSFLVEIRWPESYPEDLPELNLDGFYNSHLSVSTKKSIITALLLEADALLGSPMTYSLFEYARDNVDELITEESATEEQETNETIKTQEVSSIRTKKVKKEVLSKAAKRRQADRLNTDGELPRGWNWVDIIKHLSKTGSS